MPPRIGISMCSTEPFRDAILPLVEDGLIDAVEREIDHVFVGGTGDNPQPPWAVAIDELYAADDALYGHGVWFSLLSAGWQTRQDAWLERLAAEGARLPHRLDSARFGYYSAGDFQRFTMMPVPYCAAAVELGVERMRLLAEAVGAPVGLENASTALSPRDATEQGAFVKDI